MKNTMKKALIVLTINLSVVSIASQLSVSADTSEDKSTGTVKFEPGSSPTQPVDPSNPTLPINPSDPGNSGTNGPLSIDYASSWKFGTQTVSAKNITYYAQPVVMTDNTTKRPLWVQVTDTRGTFAGWSLTLTQTEQFKDTSGNSLEGAQLSFNGTGSTASTSTAPASSVQSAAFNLVPGVAQTILSAKVNEGTGTNVYVFGSIDQYDTQSPTDGVTPETKSPVNLNVIGGTMRADAYTTELVWTLSDTPTQ